MNNEAAVTECPCPHPDLCRHPSHDALRFGNDKITLERILASGASAKWMVEKVGLVVQTMPNVRTDEPVTVSGVRYQQLRGLENAA
jgi:hypothetical protein